MTAPTRRPLEEAPPTFRTALAALGATAWGAWGSARFGLNQGRWRLWQQGRWWDLPCELRELEAAFFGSDGPGLGRDQEQDLLSLLELLSGAQVIHTTVELARLSVDQPGPEIIRSGVLGPHGRTAWRAPAWEGEALVSFANRPRVGGADFLCFRLDLQQQRLRIEVVDRGWFEEAADLSGLPSGAPASGFEDQS